MTKFAIEHKSSLGRSEVQNLAKHQNFLHVDSANTFKVAFQFL